MQISFWMEAQKPQKSELRSAKAILLQRVLRTILAPKFLDLSFFQKLEAGGKPSTWFPPEGLVELMDSDAHVVIN